MRSKIEGKKNDEGEKMEYFEKEERHTAPQQLYFY